MWVTALLLSAFVTGCGNGGMDPILGGGGTGPIIVVADTTAPRLISTGAINGATGLPINRNSTATFSEVMDPATLNSPSPSTSLATTFKICSTATQGGVCVTPVAGVVTYSGNTATFNPDSDLSPNTWYTSSISTGAKDLAGNALIVPSAVGGTPNPWSWQTGNATDIVAPTITVTNPADVAINIPVDKTINATFSEAMSQATIITTNYTVKETVSSANVPGTVSYDVQNNIASFVPTSNLTPDTNYTVTVSNVATDLAGNALVAGLIPNPWTFTTAPASVPPVPLAINLRGAASFGIASRAGMTSTGVTVVNGDVALYPTPTCTDSTGNAGASETCLTQIHTSPTGLTVNGSIYFAGDPFDNGGTANSVSNDLQIAWNEGLAKTNTMGTVAADELGGKTFTPGIYTNANLGLATGLIATMDALGDANAIFIFQVGGVAPAGDLTAADNLGVPGEIKLVNGAQARNVWFVVGRDITIGIKTIWKGNILAGRDATVKNDAAVEGRVLAGASGSGAITLTGAASPSVTTINVP
jgi:hypothetical protein